MGRKVKRIHIDFDWFERKPGKVWAGYLLDDITCPLCNGLEVNSFGKDCALCDGGTTSPVVEPPAGYDYEGTKGYQIWETCSEGSPISPVFLKPKDLAKWMVENDDSVTKDTTYGGWLKFIIEEQSVPTCVLSHGKLSSCVAEFNNEMKNEQ